MPAKIAPARRRLSQSVEACPPQLSEPTRVGECKGYEKKRAIAEGRANGACVRSERRGTARLRFA